MKIIYTKKKEEIFADSFCKRDQKWKFQICSNYKKIYIGKFNSETGAAKAYNKSALEYHGKYTCLN